MADFDAAVVQQIPDIPEGKRETDIQDHRQADYFGRRPKVLEQAALGERYEPALPSSSRFALTSSGAPMPHGFHSGGHGPPTLDEVFFQIGGRIHHLWSAFDDEGEVLAIIDLPGVLARECYIKSLILL